MSVLPVGIGASSSSSYQIDNSLRFRASASAYLSRTPGSSGNRKTWTWSGWVKRGALSSYQRIFVADGGASRDALLFNDTNTISFWFNDASSGVFTTTAVFRDPSAWCHIVVSVDTTQSTNTNRFKFYVNEVQQAFSSATYPAQNYDGFVNNNVVHNIGRQPSGVQYFDGYLSEINFIDGQALDPSSFGETNSDGVWVPKAYEGTYGNNGFHLDFSDATSTTTLGYDVSGNNNDWTCNNISLTAGVTYDHMVDTPTDNFAVLNPLIPSAANITNGNLSSGTTAARGTINSTMIDSQWFVTAGGSGVTAGVIDDSGTANTTTVTANKVFAFRMTTAGALSYKNVTDAGAWTSIATGLTGNRWPYSVTQAASWNFGQQPLPEAMDTGFKALCTANLPNVAITTSGNFTGNAAADGPFVWLNGNPETMTINGNAVTFGTHADKTAGGFKVRSSSASYNASGSNSYSITTAGKKFRLPNNAQGNP